MSDVTNDLNLPADPPVADQTTTPDKASFLAKTSKAFAGGVTGLVAAVGTSVGVAFADGKFDESDIWVTLTALIGGFVVGFAGVYAAPANKK